MATPNRGPASRAAPATRRDQRPPPRRDERRPAQSNGANQREEEPERRPPAQAESRELTRATQSTTIPADLESMMQEDVGKGVSTDAADNLVPLLYVLQPLSPQVLPDNQAYMDGARAGDIWVKNAPDPIVPGEEGVWFQPCSMYQKIVEWVPRTRGGGFVASHDTMPPGAKQKERDPENPRKVPGFKTPDGNDLVDTRYEAGLLWRNGVAMPYVIPFKSTGHSVSRGWMTKRNGLQRPDGGIMASWSHVYLLTTAHAQNASGEWYKISVGDPVPLWQAADVVGDYQRAYKMGRALHHAFQSGDKREAPEEDTGEFGVEEGGAAQM
jgi:hypothetical protein